MPDEGTTETPLYTQPSQAEAVVGSTEEHRACHGTQETERLRGLAHGGWLRGGLCGREAGAHRGQLTAATAAVFQTA